MQKPKILIALARFPYPAVDGTRYKILHNVSDALKADFDLEYFVVSLGAVAAEDKNYLEQTYGKVRLFTLSRGNFLLNSLRSFFSGLPFQTSGFYLPTASRWIKKNITKYAAVYAHTIRMAEYFTDLPESEKKKVLVEFNDAISLNYKGAKEKARFPRSLVYRIEERRVRAYEERLLAAFAHFNVVSTFDRDYLLELVPKARRDSIDFVAIAHGVQEAPVKHIVRPLHAAYFIGQLDYDMNREAVAFFLDAVWPLVRARVPDARFFIVGRGGDTLRAKYGSMEGVTFSGFVADQYSIMQDCACLAAPVLSGAGMPSKILEALGYGMPVVTTPLGVRGIMGAKNGENMYIIKDTDTEAWAEMIETLMKGAAGSREVAEKSLALFSDLYSETGVQKEWLSLFKRIAREQA